MKRKSETKSISDLINNTIFSQKSMNEKMDVVLRHATIFSFWSDIVGAKFSKFSKPISIKSSKLFVSVSSPVLIQELTLCKRKLIEKINSYSKPLNIEIKDIVFNYKNYKEEQKEEINLIEDKPIWIDEEDLSNVKLDNEMISQIEKNISKLKFLDEEQKENFVKKIINNHKAKIIRKK